MGNNSKDKSKEIVVILSNLPWDFPCDYIKNTAIELSKRAEVVVFEPITPTTIWRRPRKKKADVVFSNLDYFPSIGLIPFQRFTFVAKANHCLATLLLRVYVLIKYKKVKPIIWCFSQDLAKQIDYYRWGKVLVYDRVDQNSSLNTLDDKRLKNDDKKMLLSAGYIFVNSPYAKKYCESLGIKSYLVPCGANLDLFTNSQLKPILELEKIPKPIIGLAGSLDHRLDFKILLPLIKNRRDWSFVFIGSQFSNDTEQARITDLYDNINEMKDLPNVHFTGFLQSKNDLPFYYNYFDVCIIPYDTKLEFVKGCNPMKLYEYLAMGKPVVSTPIEAVSQHQPVVKIAKNASEFGKAMDGFLSFSSKVQEEERKKIAKLNSWAKKVNKMWGIVTGQTLQ